MTEEIKNAIIKSAKITNDDHNILTVWLDLNYGGSGQGFGGYTLYSDYAGLHSKNYAGHFIWRCLEIGGVSDWSGLPGKTIRVKVSAGRIIAIGHIIEDDWFNPGEDFKS